MPTIVLIASSAAKLPTVAGQRAEHAQLRAIVAIVGVERIADEAAVAGPAAEQADLPLELHCGGGHERDAEPHAGIADRQPGREIVAAVDHQVMAGKQLPAHCPASIRSWTGPAFDESVEPLHELQRELGLGLAGIALAE